MDEHQHAHHNEHPADQATSAPASSNAAPATDGLRALALRLLWPQQWSMASATGEPELLVGQLPQTLPVAILLPPTSRVIGSLAGQERATIVLDCDLAVEAVLDFYREQLGAEGWSVPRTWGPMQGGFVYGDALPQTAIQFCQAQWGLRVSIYETPGRPLDVRLQFDTYRDVRHSPCAPPDPRHAIHNRIWAIIPALQPPPGAVQHPGGGSGSEGLLLTTASLSTDLDLPAVAAHYARQLERAHWALVDEGASGPAGWSMWTLADEEGKPWHGVFLALRQAPAASGYFVLVRAVRDGVDTGASGGSKEGWSVSHSVLRSQ